MFFSKKPEVVNIQLVEWKIQGQLLTADTP
jgi:hypothetical protein